MVLNAQIFGVGTLYSKIIRYYFSSQVSTFLQFFSFYGRARKLHRRSSLQLSVGLAVPAFYYLAEKAK